MSEKFSDYADVKQLLLERLVGDLQRRIDRRAQILRRARLGESHCSPWVNHGGKSYNREEEGFEAALEGTLSECEEQIQLAILGLTKFWEEDSQPKGKVKTLCSAFSKALSLLTF